MIGHDSGPELARFEREPVRYFHVPVDSSNTLRERLDLGAMPRWRANCSHLVGCLGGGGGWCVSEGGIVYDFGQFIRYMNERDIIIN